MADLTLEVIKDIRENAYPQEHIDEYGNVYVKNNIYTIVKPDKYESLNTSTLSSIVDAVEKTRKHFEGDLVCHVYTERKAYLFSRKDKKEYNIIDAQAITPSIKFNEFMPQEDFIIQLSSMFCNCDEKTSLLKYVSDVESSMKEELQDNGVSQSATLKQGLTSHSKEETKQVVFLAPYRTFVDEGMEQPTSGFIFRMRKGYSGIEFGIFEADGGAWRLKAMETIKQWLKERLPEYVILIA